MFYNMDIVTTLILIRDCKYSGAIKGFKAATVPDSAIASIYHLREHTSSVLSGTYKIVASHVEIGSMC